MLCKHDFSVRGCNLLEIVTRCQPCTFPEPIFVHDPRLLNVGAIETKIANGFFQLSFAHCIGLLARFYARQRVFEGRNFASSLLDLGPLTSKLLFETPLVHLTRVGRLQRSIQPGPEPQVTNTAVFSAKEGFGAERHLLLLLFPLQDFKVLLPRL